MDLSIMMCLMFFLEGFKTRKRNMEMLLHKSVIKNT